MNVHAIRSGGWSAIVFILVVLASGFAYGIPPDANASPGAIVAFLGQYRMALLVSAWLNIPAIALFLWFAVAMRTRLRNAPAPTENLPTYALAAAITTSIPVMGTIALQSTMAFHTPVGWPPTLATAAWDAWNIVGITVFGPVGLFIFAVSLSGMRHGTLPAWLNWLGYLTAIGCLISTFTIFFETGPLSLGSPFGVFVGFLPFVVWTAAAGVVFVRTPDASVRPM